ncbi:MAG TPA: hypothetical protein GXZ51_03310 [Acholeplasma sp.]|nr:hypothetical protein [Acholeplasma sp.]
MEERTIITSYEDVLNTDWESYDYMLARRPLNPKEVIYLVMFQKDRDFTDKLIPKYKNARLYRRNGKDEYYSIIERFTDELDLYGWSGDFDAYLAIDGLVAWNFFEATKDEAEKIRWGYDLEKYEKAVASGNTLDKLPKTNFIFNLESIVDEIEFPDELEEVLNQVTAQQLAEAREVDAKTTPFLKKIAKQAGGELVDLENRIKPEAELRRNIKLAFMRYLETL